MHASSSSGHNRSADSESAESSLQVGLIPLIDLSLTLVIVFLVFMPMAMTSLIPLTSGANGDDSPGRNKVDPEAPIVLEIQPDEVKVGPVSFRSEGSLTAWLRDASASRSDKSLSVKTQAAVTQERLVTVLDWVRGSGQWKVALMTLKDAPPWPKLEGGK